MEELLENFENIAIKIAFEHGRVTRKMLLDRLPIGRYRAHEILEKLTKKGHLLKCGSGAAIHYKLRLHSGKPGFNI